MYSRNHHRAIVLSSMLLLAFIAATPVVVPVGADCQEELATVTEELNATKEQLAKVEKERDDYAQRLEDSTTILIIALILLIGSYFFFYMNTRRAKIAFLEFQKRTGATPETPEPRPRRRRRG
jgi:short subunit fatty acids transporter